MPNKFILLFLFGFVGFNYAQEQNEQVDPELYKNYREDQFYLGITYNLLNNKPSGVNQNGFSTGFHFGFIRDMPVNKERNVAIGLGLGLSSNSYNQNIAITNSNDNLSIDIIDDREINVSKNKFTTYLIEAPFELRWRNSTASKYKFLRIYPGFKIGYLIYNTSKFNSDVGDVTLSNISAFNQFQYGVTLSAGYGTWNFHAYYGLNPIFDNTAQINNETINLSTIKLGLMFYIL